MSIKTVLVIGANRGIGLQLIKTFKQRENWITIGSVRPETRSSGDPSVDDLKKTGARIIEIDYKDETTIKRAAQELSDTKLDLLVNCGGINVYPTEWDAHQADDLLERFQVMVVGPFLAVKHFLPSLQRNGGGKVMNISSDSGSLTWSGHNGRVIGYRMAKAALNQQTKTLSIDFKKAGIPVSFIAFEPGFISTRLTRWKGEDDIAKCCEGMVDIVDKMKVDDPRSGIFLDWKGDEVPY